VMESIPRDVVEAAERERERSRRAEAREAKLAEQRLEQVPSRADQHILVIGIARSLFTRAYV
jgi:hypothetical protein